MSEYYHTEGYNTIGRHAHHMWLPIVALRPVDTVLQGRSLSATRSHWDAGLGTRILLPGNHAPPALPGFAGT